MQHAKSLPTSFVEKYHHWKSVNYGPNKPFFAELAKGQNPPAMVISCCDSRVHATALFGAAQGQFFVHRNIANFVPSYDPQSAYQGTTAAVEYAVTALGVSHIFVLGHSSCGGVRGCHDLCTGQAPALEKPESAVGRWVENLRPAFEKVQAIPDEQTRVDQLERQAVILSLENLMTFPYVKDAVHDAKLSLHGMWVDIGSGRLEQFDPDAQQFEAV